MPRPRRSFCWMWFHSLSRVAPPSEKIALDIGDLAFDGVHEGGAADGAVGADARVGLRVLDPQLGGRGQRGSEVGAESRQAAEGGGAAGAGRDADEIAS